MLLAGWRANFDFGSADADSINAAVWVAVDDIVMALAYSGEVATSPYYAMYGERYRDVVTSYSPLGDYDDYISALDRDPNAVAVELERLVG
jgi:hypothetical protein